MIRPALAAGHPATAAAGAEILRAGGNAADAAVAASLASCVAETIMTGLLGGAHAFYYDAATGVARNLDCFVAVPSGEGAPMESLQVPFGEELVHYAVGPASCGSFLWFPLRTFAHALRLVGQGQSRDGCRSAP